MKKDVIKTIVTMLLIAMLGCTIIGCGEEAETKKEQSADDEQSAEDDKADKDTEAAKADRSGEDEQSEGKDKAGKQDKESEVNDDKTSDDKKEEPAQKASAGSDAGTDAGNAGEIDEWKGYESIEAVLDRYTESTDHECDGYVMFDVDADGTEELILTDHDRIYKIFSEYGDRTRCVFVNPGSSDVRVYRDGIIGLEGIDEAGQAYEHWSKYYTELGDYLSTYEKIGEEYYTFCNEDLSKDQIEEIKRAYTDTGYYPAWLGEWGDMITQKEYESTKPKTKPVELLKPDELSDRSALEVKPEYLLYVNAPDGYVNLRTGPGTDYDIICRIPNDESLESYRKQATAQNGKNWLKVTYFNEEDNEVGYKWLTGWVAESQVQ